MVVLQLHGTNNVEYDVQSSHISFSSRMKVGWDDCQGITRQIRGWDVSETITMTTLLLARTVIMSVRREHHASSG
jgi:hypothetical protein